MEIWLIQVHLEQETQLTPRDLHSVGHDIHRDVHKSHLERLAVRTLMVIRIAAIWWPLETMSLSCMVSEILLLLFHNIWSSKHIKKCIAIAHNCTASPHHNIWHSSISLPTKLWLYLHPSHHSLWSQNMVPTRQLARNLDAFDQWCLCHIPQISWRVCIYNEAVHQCTDQQPLTRIIHTTCLKFFGHIACAIPSMDHSRALWALLCWSGWPYHT